ncbi:MAG TPA: hypothetical protein VL443_06350 [Cyclobacteriaceae bacterium]|jgi:hypothetical protein|nr:hypothetical protein [Cyclobacteriaceae bacterium]
MAFNFGGAATGALGGAASGATLGSIVPGIGTAVGAGIGGLAGLFGGGFTGRKGGFKQTPNKFSPQQQSVLNLLLQQGQQGLQNPLAGFGDVENYAKQQFQSNIVPGIAERFTAMGGSDTRGSSDFAGSLGSAGAGLASELAALRQQYGTQNQQNALQLLQLGLEPQFENYYESGDPGIGPQLLSSGVGAASNYFGSQALGNKAGGINVSGNDLQRILAVLRSR